MLALEIASNFHFNAPAVGKAGPGCVGADQLCLCLFLPCAASLQNFLDIIPALLPHLHIYPPLSLSLYSPEPSLDGS